MIEYIFTSISNFIGSASFYQWISVILIVNALYIYYFYQNIYWEKLGVRVPYLRPLPFIGNDIKFFLGIQTFHDSQRELYAKLGDVRFGGTYRLMDPVFFIKDPDLIEKIMTKDFAHFVDRGTGLSDSKEPLAQHLFNLNGKKWKGLRSKLSPLFTSGKLRTMHHQLVDCADVLVQVLDANSKADQMTDVKETMAKFTTDVIGSCAYGLNMNSLKDPDNEFRRMGRKVFETSLARKIRRVVFFLLLSIWPKLTILIRPFPKEITDFFVNLVRTTVKAREDNPQYNRNDFIQLIMNLRHQNDETHQGQEEAKHHTKKDDSRYIDTSIAKEEVYLDENMMAANSFLFFVAGFETTASTLTYCLFELSRHPEIQEKLYNEVKDVLSKHDGQPSYEAIKNLHYMEMVISETLRKYPPVPLLFRICTENYRVPDTELVLPKGCKAEIPVYSLHHDHNIYPNPEQFIPERFSPENKDSIPKGAYLPFGDGPRICIGARFAQMEIKVCLSKILSKYRIIKNPQMSDVIEFDPKSSIILIPKGNIMMNIEPR